MSQWGLNRHLITSQQEPWLHGNARCSPELVLAASTWPACCHMGSYWRPVFMDWLGQKKQLNMIRSPVCLINHWSKHIDYCIRYRPPSNENFPHVNSMFYWNFIWFIRLENCCTLEVRGGRCATSLQMKEQWVKTMNKNSPTHTDVMNEEISYKHLNYFLVGS